MSRLTRILLPLFVVLSFAFPLFAQDVTIEPTVEFITVVPSEVPTLEPTLTLEPTVAPTPEPTPVPPIEQPPIDESRITEWVIVLLVVLVAGIVTVAFVGIRTAGAGAPEWIRSMLFSGAYAGLDSLDKRVKETETPIDDMAVAELRRLVDQLRNELRATQQQVAQIQTVQTAQRS